ncbi:hypothetical protein AB1Y20_002776 [Prymnesium parvum]|uniref:CHK kinase-like domain-containing protein n=1 Tax=Prymnesium parvum TaxID=97485 RepID=A0AB34JC41_PRYPA|mmetsp:Transcript_34887/g.86773  ORF Transcript_34887/g.86773 Transcript_34887/m.86773 type:complete len:512 (-) Transcript_34887:731-2266(-)
MTSPFTSSPLVAAVVLASSKTSDNDEELYDVVARPISSNYQAGMSRELVEKQQVSDSWIAFNSGAPPTTAAVRPPNYVRVGGKMPKNIATPPTGDQITKEWLTEVFRFRGTLPYNGRVVEMVKKRIGEGQGEFGDLYAIEITQVENAHSHFPRYLIAKICPVGKTTAEKIGLKIIYQNEAHFYNDFTVEGGGLPRPECYHVGADLKGLQPKFIFLIGNGFLDPKNSPAKLYSRVSGCDNEEHLFRVMKALALFHAKWWGHPGGKKPFKWALHPLLTMKGLLLNAVPILTKGGLKALPKLFNDQKHPDGSPVAKWGADYEPILSWLPILKRRFRYLAKELYRPPLTLCHQDTHLENIFFHERYPGGCAFIDFGNIGFGHALSDITFFLATSIDVEVRRAYEQRLVKYYHEHLVAGGVTDYPYTLCQHDYKIQLWRSFIQVLTIIPDFAKARKNRTGMFALNRDEAGEKLLQMYAGFNKRLATALLDHEWIKMLEEVAYTSCCSMLCCVCKPS